MARRRSKSTESSGAGGCIMVILFAIASLINSVSSIESATWVSILISLFLVSIVSTVFVLLRNLFIGFYELEPSRSIRWGAYGVAIGSMACSLPAIPSVLILTPPNSVNIEQTVATAWMIFCCLTAMVSIRVIVREKRRWRKIAETAQYFATQAGRQSQLSMAYSAPVPRPDVSSYPPNYNLFDTRQVRFDDSYEISPGDFERRIAWVLNRLQPQMKAVTVGGSGDEGVDVKVYDPNIRKLIGIVQAKKYSPQSYLPMTALRDLKATKHDHRVETAIMVTTAQVSRNARQYADRNGLRVIDGKEFAKYYKQAYEAERETGRIEQRTNEVRHQQLIQPQAVTDPVDENERIRKQLAERQRRLEQQNRL